MAQPADKPGSPTDWFNKNAAVLLKDYPDEWVVMSGKGVELHDKEPSKVFAELDKKLIEARRTWIVAYVPKAP